MLYQSLCRFATTGLFIVAQMGLTAAADLKVLTTPALTEVWHELAPKFEATGHKLSIVYAASGAIAKRVTDGEAADLLVSTPAGIDGLIKAGKVTDGTNTPLASSGMGVAVLKGAPKPDISTPDAFRRALLAAKAVAYTDPASGGASGAHMAKVLERLGIASEVNAKAKLGRGIPVATLRGQGRGRHRDPATAGVAARGGRRGRRSPARRPAERDDLRGGDSGSLHAGGSREGADPLPADAGISRRDQKTWPRPGAAGRAAEGVVRAASRPHTTIITGFSISVLNAPISSAPSAPSTAR
jgi:hypothetical protein